MSLRIFNKYSRRVEPHRLIVEYCGGEGGKKMEFQPCAGIRDQREAGGVRLGNPSGE